jgi:DNA processing protein
VNHLANLIALCLVPGIGGVTLRALLDRFGNTRQILDATPEALQAVAGIGPRTASAIKAADVPCIAGELAHWQQTGIQILTWSHPHYPDALYPLQDAPPVLFCRGKLLPDDAHAVGLVGTRRPTPAARQLAAIMGRELAQRGLTVISGLAWGIDMASHTGALETGRTIAVLGSGVLNIPDKKRALAQRIIENGAILAEVHPDMPPAPATLVARNRLISGMSRATIVIESAANGGSLYTAQFAIRQGRQIFAVDNGSTGNSSLLANGAHRLAADHIDWDALVRRITAP